MDQITPGPALFIKLNVSPRNSIAKCYSVVFIICILFMICLTNQAFAQQQDKAAMKDSIRIATFNIGLDQAREKGQLSKLLQNGDYVPALKSAEIIQRIRPDIILINEIDGNDQQQTLDVYLEQYLATSQNKQKPLNYPYRYMPDCNTGLNSGAKFRDADGDESEENDNYGFGHYEGQYCMAVLSNYPFKKNHIHSFQRFLWKDLPEPLLPNLNGVPWYSKSGLEHIRLSSKTHADVPVMIGNQLVHLLISHPTPPVFDGEEDRNGKRNHDELKFWQYYINGISDKQKDGLSWLKDDNGKPAKGLSNAQRFVIMGDLNASMVEGDASEKNGLRAIEALIHDPRVATGFSEKQDSQHIPQSPGGKQNAATEAPPSNQYSQYHTAVWKMRADYVLPSAYGIDITGKGVYWPLNNKPLSVLVNGNDDDPSSSDHRLVWLDIQLTDLSSTDIRLLD